MKFYTKNNDTNTEIVVFIEGSLDTITAPEFDSAIEKYFHPDLKKLILDFTNVDYISSAGLRVILRINKLISNYGNLILRHLNPEVREIFSLTGFDDLLQIE